MDRAVHEDFVQQQLREITKPERNVAGARAAQLSAEGADRFVAVQDDAFLTSNRVALATQIAAELAKQVGACQRQHGGLVKQLGRTPRFLSKRRTEPVNPSHIVLAAVLTVVALASMAVGNAVLSGYVSESASPLFANNPTHAILFSLLPAISAVALQQYEASLTNATTRFYLGHGLFLVGGLGLCVYLCCTALTFAPSAGTAVDLLMSDQGNRWVPVALVMSTIAAEIGFGATILKRIGHLLSSETCEAIPNPEFIALTRERGRLERQIAGVKRNQMRVEDYLIRAEAAREVTRREALQELDKARELWLQAQMAALAFAIAIFLSTPEEID